MTIVGVVGDARNPAVKHWQPAAYRPFAQAPLSLGVMMIRTALADPGRLAAPVRAEIRALDPTVPEPRMSLLANAVYDYAGAERSS